MTILSAILSVAALIIAITIGLELVARGALRRSGYAVYAPGSRVRLELDPATHPTLEPVVTYSINRDGERGPEPPHDARGLYRVLVTGGSAAEGFLNDQESCWPMVLARRLAAPDSLATLRRTRVHVGTIGRSGFDAAALERTCRHILPRYPHLDAIIVVTGVGDVMRWLSAGTPGSDGIWESTAHETFARRPDLCFGWRPRRLAIAEVFRRVRAQLVVERHERAAAWMGRARRARVAAWQRGEMINRIPDPAIVLERYAGHLRAALELARGRADRVVVMLQPIVIKETLTDEERAHLWNGCRGQAYRDDVRTFYSDAVLGRLTAAVTARTREIALELGLEVVDPAQALEPGLRHFFDHAHFTVAGSAVVADLVARHLLEAASPAEDAGLAHSTCSPAAATPC